MKLRYYIGQLEAYGKSIWSVYDSTTLKSVFDCKIKMTAQLECDRLNALPEPILEVGKPLWVISVGIVDSTREVIMAVFDSYKAAFEYTETIDNKFSYVCVTRAELNKLPTIEQEKKLRNPVVE